MKKLLLFTMLALLACTQPMQKPGPKDSRAAEAWEKIDDGALVVDVRTPAEFESGHIDGALNIPHDQVSSRIAEISDHKDKPVVLYCRTGRRAGEVEQKLEASGFQHVLNGGGFEELQSAR